MEFNDDSENIEIELNETLDGLNQVYANYEYELKKFEKEEYTYPIECILNQDLTQITNGRVHICPYQVNIEGPKPFLQFFLLKNQPSSNNANSDIVRFHTLEYNNDGSLYLLCDSVVNIIFTCFKKLEYLHIYKGYINKGSDYYVFYDCSLYQIGVHSLHRRNDIWITLVDEIINSKMTCNFNIDKSVSEFFLNNLDATHLLDNKGKLIEMPTVVYSSCIKKQTEFVSIFGVPKAIKYRFNNPYFYFTDYSSAIKSEECEGINRFAVFLGKMKATVLSDELDYEETGSSWDCLYFMNEDGEPVWALKEYEKQIPLTSHIKNKKSDKNEIR
jgi:hypothetical protein